MIGRLVLPGIAMLLVAAGGGPARRRPDLGAADPGEKHVERSCDGRQLGLVDAWWCRKRLSLSGFTLRSLHGDEGGAVSVQTRVVGVARGLIDACFAAEFGVDGLYRQAVALDAAVAAAFAHRLVDEDAQRGILEAIKAEQINVQEMENIIFEGAEAAIARARPTVPPGTRWYAIGDIHGSYTKLARFSDACGAEIPRWIRRRPACTTSVASP